VLGNASAFVNTVVAGKIQIQCGRLDGFVSNRFRQAKLSKNTNNRHGFGLKARIISSRLTKAVCDLIA
jgi:hypothetical protein